MKGPPPHCVFTDDGKRLMYGVPHPLDSVLVHPTALRIEVEWLPGGFIEGTVCLIVESSAVLSASHTLRTFHLPRVYTNARP